MWILKVHGSQTLHVKNIMRHITPCLSFPSATTSTVSDMQQLHFQPPHPLFLRCTTKGWLYHPGAWWCGPHDGSDAHEEHYQGRQERSAVPTREDPHGGCVVKTPGARIQQHPYIPVPNYTTPPNLFEF